MMKRYAKIFTSLLVALFFAFGLSACGSALEKPTGLEESENQLASIDDKEEIDKEIIKEKEDLENNTNRELSKVEEETTDTSNSNIVQSSDEENQTTSTQEESVANKNLTKSKTKDEQTKSDNDGGKNSNRNSKKDKITESQAENNAQDQGPTEKTVKDNKKSDQEKDSSSESDKEKEEEKTKNTLVYSIVISDSEVPLPPTEMEVLEGDTVLEALIRITKDRKIQMDYRGGRGATAYVEGIDNVYEFDRGQGSGWMYRVNGIFPDRGAGVVPLLPGDRVEWLYTTDLGKDLGADLQPFRR